MINFPSLYSVVYVIPSFKSPAILILSPSIAFVRVTVASERLSSSTSLKSIFVNSLFVRDSDGVNLTDITKSS